MSYPVYYVEAGDVLPILFDTFDGGTGASITMTGLAVTDIEIYKDGSVTQRASDAGYTLLDTDGIDFDSITGIHGFSIDLSDNTDAGFYAAGSWYHVVISAITVDSQTVSFVAAAFRIVSATRGLAGTALPDAAADAAGGLPISDAGALALDTLFSNIAAILLDTGTTLDDLVDDLESRLGTPSDLGSGATIAANLADIEAQTDDIGTAGAGLTDLGGMSTGMKAEVNAEVDTAIETYHLDHLLAADYDPASKPGTSTALFNELIENDGGVSRFTANALEEAPSGGTSAQVLIDTTIATVTTQTSFTLTAGSDQNDAYNGQSIVLYDVTNSDYPCVRRVMDYVGSTKRVTLDTAPNFTIAGSDEVKIFVSGAFASIKGATEVTDILIDDSSNPIEGAEVWITTGAAGTNTIWNGVTDASGVPKDVNDENPFLDPGTYYIWVQKSDYSFTNPTTLTVT